MHAGRDPNVKALLQRLEPAQRQPQTGIRLAGRNRLQQLVGRSAEIDKFDVEIVLGENTPFFCNRRSDGAGRVRIPGELELTRWALQLFAARSRPANERCARNGAGRRQGAGRSEYPERRGGPENASEGQDRAAGEPASLHFRQTVGQARADFACLHGAPPKLRPDRLNRSAPRHRAPDALGHTTDTRRLKPTNWQAAVSLL